MNKTALLVMDMQNDLVHEKGKGASFGIPIQMKQRRVIQNTKRLIELARSAGVKIIYVKVEFSQGAPEIALNKEPLLAGIRQSGMLATGTWGAEIHDEIAPKEDDMIIVKHRINPFSNPAIEKQLKGIQTLLLAGVATNFVVEATARSAADRDFDVIVVDDCCASMTKEMHDFSITSIIPMIGRVMTSKEVMQLML